MGVGEALDILDAVDEEVADAPDIEALVVIDKTKVLACVAPLLSPGPPPPPPPPPGAPPP